MKKYFHYFILLFVIFSCTNSIDHDSLSVGQLHNEGLDHLVNAIKTKSSSFSFDAISSVVNDFAQQYELDNEVSQDPVILSAVGRNEYKRLNAILLHSDNVNDIDTLLLKIQDWSDSLSMLSNLDVAEKTFLLETGDIAYNSVLYWNENAVGVSSLIADFIYSNNEVNGRPEGSKKVTGRIVSEDGEGVPGAAVVVQGTNVGGVANYDGDFEFLVPNGNNVYLVISCIGFQDVTIRVGSNSNIGTILIREDYSILYDYPDNSGSYPSGSTVGNIAVLAAHDAVGYLMNRNVGMSIVNSMLAGFGLL